MSSRHKKSTPHGAPILKQDHGTTPEEISHATFLFGLIGEGRDNALKRPKGKVDRTLRRLIAEANERGDCIINNGKGYFRPDDTDGPEVERYLMAELRRAKKIQDKVDAMREAYFGRY